LEGAGTGPLSSADGIEAERGARGNDRGSHRQKIDLLDLQLPTPAPDGAAWIDAYRYWAGR
jgi:hypothetical protein